MANLLYANNAIGTLAAPITNVQTAITLNPGQAALFPNPSAPQVFYATLTDAATQTLKEIVQVTAVAGDIFSVVRAQDGTTGLSWNTGDIIEQCVIRLELQGFENAAEGLFGATGLNTAIHPSTTLGIVGTTLADNAVAGSVGELLSASGAGVPTAPNTPTTALTLSLTAGDWDVYGTNGFAGSGTVNVQNIFAGISTTAGAFSIYPNAVTNAGGISLTSASIAVPVNIVAPMTRVNVATTTSVFLITQAGYSGGGTVTSFGNLYARRVR